jgi:hypothetical protein
MIRIEGIPVVAARLAAVAKARKTAETDPRFNAEDQSVPARSQNRFTI